MHSGYYSRCSFNIITMSCPLLSGSKYEGSSEQNKKHTTMWRCEAENHVMNITCALHLVS